MERFPGLAFLSAVGLMFLIGAFFQCLDDTLKENKQLKAQLKECQLNGHYPFHTTP